MEANRIGYREVLRAIMNMDFPSRTPRIQDRVYFVNRSRNIILHMYDDRGMDLIAPSVEGLKAIYQQHKDWVLDYDRSSIEERFEAGTHRSKD